MNKCIAIVLLLLMTAHEGYAKKPMHVEIGAYITNHRASAITFMQWQLLTLSIAGLCSAIYTPNLSDHTPLSVISAVGIGMLGMKCMRSANKHIYTALVHARDSYFASVVAENAREELQATITGWNAIAEVYKWHKNNYSVSRVKGSEWLNDSQETMRRSTVVAAAMRHAIGSACVGVLLVSMNAFFNPLGYQLTKTMLPTVGSMGTRCLGPLINNVILSSLYLLS